MKKINSIARIIVAASVAIGIGHINGYAQKMPPLVTTQPPAPLMTIRQAPHGTFRFTLNGIHVNHETNDDILGLDGSGDEVLNAFVALPVEVDESQPQSAGTRGIASNLVGNMHTGSDYPNREALTNRTQNPGQILSGMPSFYYPEKELWANRNAVVIVPMLFERDNERTELWGELLGSFNASQPTILNTVRQMIRGANVNQFQGTTLDSLPSFVTLTPGITGIGPKTRPIGMVKVGDQLVYHPKMLVFTYAAAEEAARTDYGHGRGIIEVKYDEDQSLAGSYVLYIQVEKIN